MGEPDFSLFAAPRRASGPASRRGRGFFGQIVLVTLVLLAAGLGVLAGLVFVYSSDLPRIEQLEDYRPDVITELYADDGTVIGTFALEHRVIVGYNEIPPVLKDAVVSIEDRHFESHWGVDALRIIRAGMTDLLEWRKAQGASTLTQQLSRMLFLTPEKSFGRKMQEILLAIQIERRFTKPQIFTLYTNQVPLGHGVYGFEAASQFYFGKHLNQLTLPEGATLAGIPRAPTAYSPILYPDRARERRNVVLLAMYENGKIGRQQYLEARSDPLTLNLQPWTNTTAPYFVEDVRQFLEKKYGTEAVQEKGLKVYTTLNQRMQRIAEKALIDGLHEDDKRRGWRGAERNILKTPVVLANGRTARLETYTDEDWKKPLQPGSRVHGLVMEVRPGYAVVRFGSRTARLTSADFAWTGREAADKLLARGDLDQFQIKEVSASTVHAVLDQKPNVQGAVVVIENATGAIKAMVGGYSYEESKFNRARQAERQVGSSFKPYLYAEALLEGANPFDTISDTPISFPTGSGVWSPHNYDGRYEGAMPLLRALAESRNVPAVRLIAKIGVDKVIKLAREFGITSRLPSALPLALGAADLTLVEHTSGFTVFPNDGVHISPRTVLRVTNYEGRVIDDFAPEVTEVLPVGIARVETSMLREVVNSGTALRAKSLDRPVAGKTGTTNDYSDAWFVGFTPSLTCGVWVGFDDHQTLGPHEEGAKVALPIWMQFMSEALKDQPVEDFPNSPLLASPEQVAQILASAGTERLLAMGAADRNRNAQDPAANSNGTKSAAPGKNNPPAETPPR